MTKITDAATRQAVQSAYDAVRATVVKSQEKELQQTKTDLVNAFLKTKSQVGHYAADGTYVPAGGTYIPPNPPRDGTKEERFMNANDLDRELVENGLGIYEMPADEVQETPQEEVQIQPDMEEIVQQQQLEAEGKLPKSDTKEEEKSRTKVKVHEKVSTKSLR
ncbi:kinase-related family [Trichomonas vaginalis G3]|uniref:kinase-related family n=1 Tax=Trichomonas vaginalis (strain ATCC PRA-98 / G3) TaxID=412133 RepID=UPI0021E5D7F0|nr:kinase-related family [Trichomonas vaginalis G3]KAI5516908.1 kinase-related family [Trichomonas vaginalis G3]